MKWEDKPYHSLNHYYKEVFGGKVYKLSLDGGMSCPNRDGTVDRRGCIFCSRGGSGDFAASRLCCSERLGRSIPDIPAQIAGAKALVQDKLPRKGFAGYIAYFQAYTNTYEKLPYLETIFTQALSRPEILGISIATRPDCLEPEKIDLLSRLNRIKPVYVELGLQTIHARTAEFIRRGYELEVFEDAVRRLKAAGLNVTAHVILGLPGETPADMMETCDYLAEHSVDGIKLQLLHILEGTDLAELKDTLPLMELPEYAALVVSIIEKLPPGMVIHRITGDGPKKDLLAPLWSADKKKVLNTIMKEFAMRDTWQGKYYGS